MRKSILICLVFNLLSIAMIRAQSAPEVPRITELGVRFAGVQDFDFFYKKQKKDEVYMRYRFISGSFSRARNTYSVNAGAAAGIEKRVPVSDKFKFVKGLELIGSGAISNISGRGGTFYNISPGIGLVLGMQYDINENVYLSLETIPSIILNLNRDWSRRTYLDVFAGFDSRSVALNLMYRFNKTK